MTTLSAPIYWYTYASTGTYLLDDVYTCYSESDDVMEEPEHSWTVLAGPEPA